MFQLENKDDQEVDTNERKKGSRGNRAIVVDYGQRKTPGRRARYLDESDIANSIDHVHDRGEKDTPDGYPGGFVLAVPS